MCERKTFLQVHHINRNADGGTSEAKNLITLCSSCHKKITKLDFYENVYPQEKETKVEKQISARYKRIKCSWWGAIMPEASRDGKWKRVDRGLL